MNSVIFDTGSQFNNLTIVKFLGSIDIGHKHTMNQYLCRCSCGRELILSQGEIVSGHIKSCGCSSKVRKQPLIYDLTGQRFGKLVVINQAKTFWSDSGKSRMIRWNCICDCGNMVTVNSRALRTGATQSCGCHQKQRVSETLTDNLIGKQFGRLTVIERAGSHKRQTSNSGVCAMWKCRCECGNEIITYGWSLKCGDTTSCGCSKISQAEIYVHSILSEFGFVKDVNYFSEKTFPDLVGVNGGKLRFDFMVYLSDGVVFIECQGEQHYKSVDYFGGDESFALRVQNDNLKREWINKHGYKLIEIPYTVHSYDDFLKILVKEHIIELANRVSE